MCIRDSVDPLPQALVLTAIVIGFAMTAVTIVIAIRNRSDSESDHVDAGIGLDYAGLMPIDTDREETFEDLEACATAPTADNDGTEEAKEVTR